MADNRTFGIITTTPVKTYNIPPNSSEILTDIYVGLLCELTGSINNNIRVTNPYILPVSNASFVTVKGVETVSGNNTYTGIQLKLTVTKNEGETTRNSSIMFTGTSNKNYINLILEGLYIVDIYYYNEWYDDHVSGHISCGSGSLNTYKPTENVILNYSCDMIIYYSDGSNKSDRYNAALIVDYVEPETVYIPADTPIPITLSFDITGYYNGVSYPGTFTVYISGFISN